MLVVVHLPCAKHVRRRALSTVGIRYTFDTWRCDSTICMFLFAIRPYVYPCLTKCVTGEDNGKRQFRVSDLHARLAFPIPKEAVP
jgi:hypothetical protein